MNTSSQPRDPGTRRTLLAGAIAGRAAEVRTATTWAAVATSGDRIGGPKNLRSRYGSAGNKDDRFDAFVLADTLRTDRARLRPLVPDSPATTALRATCRARRDLVAHRAAVANQLREHLKRVFPGPLGLFEDLDSVISLTFLTPL